MLRVHWLNRIAVLGGFFGVLLLLAYSLAVKPVFVEIGEVNEGLLGERVSLEGRVLWKTEKNSTVIFSVSDGNALKGVKFNASAAERFALKEDSFVRLTGKIQEYRGELEIVSEGVELLD